MSYSIAAGTLAEAIQVDAQIREFERKKTADELSARLTDKAHLVLIAKHRGKPVGYLVGYQHSPTEFYNWLTGVAADHRGQGVASQLLTAIESWAQARGYQQLSVKSKNRFPSMLRLLIGNGYQITDYEQSGDLLENKIHFSKRIG